MKDSFYGAILGHIAQNGGKGGEGGKGGKGANQSGDSAKGGKGSSDHLDLERFLIAGAGGEQAAPDISQVSRNKGWGAFGDEKDLDDGWTKDYTREVCEYELDASNCAALDPNKGKGCASGGYPKRASTRRSVGNESEDPNDPSEGLYYPDGSLIRDSRTLGGFGDKSSFRGYYRVLPFREAESVEFCRGNFATGIRGVIDPQDPDNPYGPKSKEELEAAKVALEQGKDKVEASPRAGTNPGTARSLGTSMAVGLTATTAASDALEMHNVSHASDRNILEMCARIEVALENEGLERGTCLYEKGKAAPLSSIFRIRHEPTVTHLEVPHNEKALLYDRAVDQLKEWCKGVDAKSITSLAHQTNTWGLSSNNWLADERMKKFKKLVDVHFEDTVHFRHRSDVCMGTQALLIAAAGHKIRYLNLSGNVLEEDGARSFVEFFSTNKTLRVLKLNNNGLASKSCEMIYDAY